MNVKPFKGSESAPEHKLERVSRLLTDADYVAAVEVLRGLYDLLDEAELKALIDENPFAEFLDVDTESWVLVAGAVTVADSIYNLGTILWESEKPAGVVLDVFRVAGELGSDDAPGGIGAVLVELGRSDEAKEHLRRSVELKGPTWRHSAGVLGEILVTEGRSDHAVRNLLDDAISDFPEFSLALARYWNLKERPGKAVELLRSCVADNMYGAPIELGNALDETGDAQGAEQAYRRGIEHGDGHSAYNLHLLPADQNRLDEAREMLRTARLMGDESHPFAEEDLAARE